LTPLNTRHCVNSLSMKFIPDDSAVNSETVYFAGGCFWGTEFYFKKESGILRTSVGFIGGNKVNPTYKEVCSGLTGHAEVVEVVYDPSKTSFEKLANYSLKFMILRKLTDKVLILVNNTEARSFIPLNIKKMYP